MILPALALAAVTALASASVAHAQEETAKDAESQQDEGSEASRERARALFAEGMSLSDSGDFGEALERFRESYDLVPSPNSRLMLARTLRKMGRVGDAWDEYGRVVGEARKAAQENEKYTPTLESAESERASLRAEIGILHVEIEGEPPDEAVLMVAGREIPKAEWSRPLVVVPGSATVVLIAPSVKREEQAVDIDAGGEHRVKLAVHGMDPGAPPPKATGGDKDTLLMMSYVSGGIGVAGLALFGVVVATDGNEALGVTGIAVGAVGLGMGIALFAIAQSSDDSGRTTSQTKVVAGPGSLGLAGTF
jgi:hypothetical protein